MSENNIIYFRLDLTNDNHLKAARYIDTLGRRRFGSVGDAISTAVIGYFEGTGNDTAGKTFLNSEIISDILQESVEKKLKEIIPKCLEEYFSSKNFQQAISGLSIAKEGDSEEKTGEEPEEESELKKVEADIAWDFLGG